MGRGARARKSSKLQMTKQGVLDTTVTLLRDDAREERFWIVGEDEAEPSRGTALPSVTARRGPGRNGSDRRPDVGWRSFGLASARFVQFKLPYEAEPAVPLRQSACKP